MAFSFYYVTLTRMRLSSVSMCQSIAFVLFFCQGHRDMALMAIYIGVPFDLFLLENGIVLKSFVEFWPQNQSRTPPCVKWAQVDLDTIKEFKSTKKKEQISLRDEWEVVSQSICVFGMWKIGFHTSSHVAQSCELWWGYNFQVLPKGLKEWTLWGRELERYVGFGLQPTN